MRKLIQANLGSLGLEVRTAVNGLHSLDLIRGSKPDLILLDADLPDLESSHLIERLQAELDGQVPVIILSSEPPGREQRQNGDMVSFLLKPFAIPVLLRAVRQALADMRTDDRRPDSG
jgi:CheY-like chemotaxis protein